MRICFLGSGTAAVATARHLVDSGHEVILVDLNRERLDELSESLDCGYIHGDGSKPDILREVGPEQTDFLFCMMSEDQDNIIASLVGESLGFKRVVTSITDQEFDPICHQLGLTDVINPTSTISRYLADMIGGIDSFELSSTLKHSARLFTFVATASEAAKVGDLDLPDHSRVICYYRDAAFHLVSSDTLIKEGDEVVVLTDERHLKTLRERFAPKKAD